MKKDWKYWV